MGIDIIEIEEIKKSIGASKRFIQRVFTNKEIEYCESKELKYQHYAARFAAKEAVMKALGTGWDKGIQWDQIETLNEDERQESANYQKNKRSGKPKVRLTGEALKVINEMKVDHILVSLSHSLNYAVACVIFEGNG